MLTHGMGSTPPHHHHLPSLANHIAPWYILNETTYLLCVSRKVNLVSFVDQYLVTFLAAALIDGSTNPDAGYLDQVY